jgi:hypothetical protein
MCYQPSIRLLKLYDKIQRQFLVKQGLLSPSVDDAVRLIQPLPPDEEASADARDRAWQAIESKIHKMDEHPAPRALNCGHRSTLHLRRQVPGTEQCEDLLLRPRCGRSDCPSCWRRRLAQTYRRMPRRVLDAPPKPDERGKPGRRNLPRVGPVYIAETDWLSWETFDRGIRRLHGGDCARLRIRRTSNTALFLCSLPFPGSRAVSPAEACRLASDAIDNLNPAKHSFRLLGDWSDAEPQEWTLLAQYEQVDFDAVKQLLSEHGTKSRRLKSRTVAGLIWRAENAAMADAIALLLSLCPSLAKGKRECSRRNSDRPGFDEGEIPGEDLHTPFDNGEDDQWH